MVRAALASRDHRCLAGSLALSLVVHGALVLASAAARPTAASKKASPIMLTLHEPSVIPVEVQPLPGGASMAREQTIESRETRESPRRRRNAAQKRIDAPTAAPEPAATEPSSLPSEASVDPGGSSTETTTVATPTLETADGIGSPSGPQTGVMGGNGGSGVGTAAGSGIGTGDVSAMRARYLAQVRERVTRHRRYPSAAQRLGIEGTVYVRVCIGPDGAPLSAAPVREGSDPELTIAALTAVRAASPFRPLPPKLGRSLTVDIPIAFLLEDE